MRPIVGITSWFTLLAPFVLLSVDVAGAAGKLEEHQKALDVIHDYAYRICETVKQEGTSHGVELSGKAKAEVNALLKWLANLGVEGAAKYQDSKYQGVLQEQLAEQLNNVRDCRKELALDLQARLLPKAQETPLQKPLPRQTMFGGTWLLQSNNQQTQLMQIADRGAVVEVRWLVANRTVAEGSGLVFGRSIFLQLQTPDQIVVRGELKLDLDGMLRGSLSNSIGQQLTMQFFRTGN
jgi:hypothetical protein